MKLFGPTPKPSSLRDRLGRFRKETRHEYRARFTPEQWRAHRKHLLLWKAAAMHIAHSNPWASIMGHVY